MPGSATVLPLVLLYFSSQSMVNFLGSVWWPMFVIVFYVLSPFPTLVARRFSDGEERSSLLFEVCCFITTCIVLSSYGLPIVLARKLIVSFCFLFSLCCLCDIIPFFSIQFFSILFFSIIFFLLFYILFCQVKYHLFKDTHSNYLFVFYSLVLYLWTCFSQLLTVFLCLHQCYLLSWGTVDPSGTWIIIKKNEWNFWNGPTDYLAPYKITWTILNNAVQHFVVHEIVLDCGDAVFWLCRSSGVHVDLWWPETLWSSSPSFFSSTSSRGRKIPSSTALGEEP